MLRRISKRIGGALPATLSRPDLPVARCLSGQPAASGKIPLLERPSKFATVSIESQRSPATVGHNSVPSIRVCPTIRRIKMYRFLPIFFLALILSACQTVNELPGLGSNAKRHDGQMVYQTPRTSVAGDVILRTSPNGDYDLVLLKGGVQVLQIQAHDGQLVATGMFAGNGWTGPVDRAPGPLKSWALLKQVIPYFDSTQMSAQNGSIWNATFRRNGNQLQGAKVNFRRLGSMTFSFAH